MRREDQGSAPSSAPPTKKEEKERKEKFDFNLELNTPEGIQMIYWCVEGSKMARN